MRFKGVLEGSIGQSNPEGPGGSQSRFSGPQEISGGLSGVSGGSKEFQEVSEAFQDVSGGFIGTQADSGPFRSVLGAFQRASSGFRRRVKN